LLPILHGHYYTNKGVHSGHGQGPGGRVLGIQEKYILRVWVDSGNFDFRIVGA